MNFGEMFVASALLGALNNQCITTQSIQACAEKDNAELRGRLLNHVQESSHLGKYPTWISGIVANAFLAQWSFQLTQWMQSQGMFSQSIPILGENGIYTTIDTRAWIEREKPKVAGVAISIHLWAKYQPCFQAAINAGLTTARLLERINRKDGSTEIRKQEIQDDITTISNGVLATFKQEIAKMKAIKEGDRMFDLASVVLGLQINPLDFMLNPEPYFAPSMKVDVKMDRKVIELKKIEQFFDQCIRGIQAKVQTA